MAVTFGAVLALGGCSGLPSLPSFTSSEPTTQSAEPTAQAAPIAADQKMRVSRPLLLTAMKPVVGVPPGANDVLAREINKVALRENVALLVDTDARASIVLQGYVTATRDKTSTKYSYVWHVLSDNGTRLGQVTGDEVVPAATPPEPDIWAGFSPTVSQRISERAIAGLTTTVFPDRQQASAGARTATTPAR